MNNKIPSYQRVEEICDRLKLKKAESLLKHAGKSSESLDPSLYTSNFFKDSSCMAQQLYAEKRGFA